MSNVSFPAAHLSAYDIGKRIQIVTVDGAKITDRLTQVVAKDGNGTTELYLRFASVTSENSFSGSFKVNPEQYVKRIGE